MHPSPRYPFLLPPAPYPRTFVHAVYSPCLPLSCCGLSCWVHAGRQGPSFTTDRYYVLPLPHTSCHRPVSCVFAVIFPFEHIVPPILCSFFMYEPRLPVFLCTCLRMGRRPGFLPPSISLCSRALLALYLGPSVTPRETVRLLLHCTALYSLYTLLRHCSR